MEIPSLPTDSAYKFLAVGAIILSITCFFGSFKLYDSVTGEIASRIATTLESSDFVRGLIADTPQPQPKNIEKLRQLVRDTYVQNRFREAIALLLLTYGAALQMVFFYSIAQWLRLQKINDLVVAFELAEKAKTHGVEIRVNVPKVIKI